MMCLYVCVCMCVCIHVCRHASRCGPRFNAIINGSQWKYFAGQNENERLMLLV